LFWRGLDTCHFAQSAFQLADDGKGLSDCTRETKKERKKERKKEKKNGVSLLLEWHSHDDHGMPSQGIANGFWMNRW
jgi:hypothetical protein